MICRTPERSGCPHKGQWAQAGVNAGCRFCVHDCINLTLDIEEAVLTEGGQRICLENDRFVPFEHQRTTHRQDELLGLRLAVL